MLIKGFICENDKIIFQSENGREVTIDTVTGEVEYDREKMSWDALMFWQAVSEEFPLMRSKIISRYNREQSKIGKQAAERMK